MSEFVVDSSAILALILEESDAALYHEIMVEAQPLMSIATRIEIAHVALGKLGPNSVTDIERLLQEYEVRFEPVDEHQAKAAIDASLAYGRGRGKPPAVLNYGDLFSYALAKTRDLPLLYKGGDFAKTDVRSALATR